MNEAITKATETIDRSVGMLTTSSGPSMLRPCVSITREELMTQLRDQEEEVSSLQQLVCYLLGKNEMLRQKLR